MKLKLGLLKNEKFIENVNKLATYKISPISAYALLKAVRIITVESETLEAARRNLIVKYGKTSDNNNYSVEDNGPEAMENFKIEFLEILNQEFEIPGEKIKLGLEIKDRDGNDVLLSIEEIMALENIVDFEV